MTTIIVNDEQDLINKLVSYIEKISNDSIQNRGKFYIGLSGKLSFSRSFGACNKLIVNFILIIKCVMQV